MTPTWIDETISKLGEELFNNVDDRHVRQLLKIAIQALASLRVDLFGEEV